MDAEHLIDGIFPTKWKVFGMCPLAQQIIRVQEGEDADLSAVFPPETLSTEEDAHAFFESNIHRMHLIRMTETFDAMRAANLSMACVVPTLRRYVDNVMPTYQTTSLCWMEAVSHALVVHAAADGDAAFLRALSDRVQYVYEPHICKMYLMLEVCGKEQSLAAFTSVWKQLLQSGIVCSRSAPEEYEMTLRSVRNMRDVRPDQFARIVKCLESDPAWRWPHLADEDIEAFSKRVALMISKAPRSYRVSATIDLTGDSTTAHGDARPNLQPLPSNKSKRKSGSEPDGESKKRGRKITFVSKKLSWRATKK